MAEPSWYYDEVYRTSGAYAQDPLSAPWAHLWKWCAEQVEPGEGVLELGCGPGHLAMLLDAKPYLGIDFSRVAIAKAMRDCGADFMRADLPRCLAMLDMRRFDVVVACEFLEHIDNDIGCLARLPPWVRVVATVPTFDTVGHVRWFEDEEQVVRRYDCVLPGLRVERVGDRHFGFVSPRC